jgi:hypothetical protein
MRREPRRFSPVARTPEIETHVTNGPSRYDRIAAERWPEKAKGE